MINNFPLKRLVLVAGLCLPVFTYAQEAPKTKPNWQNLDLKTDSVFGISTEKAYNELLKGKKHVTVLVAVIDGGVDVNHEDLKKVIWNNPKEIAGNKKDDDKNGYADDIHGWDFIGSAKGDVHYDNLELTRLVRINNARFANVDSTKLTGKDLADFKAYSAMKADMDKQVAKAQQTYTVINKFNTLLDGVLAKLGSQNPSLDDIKKFEPKDNGEAYVKRVLESALPEFKNVADFREKEVNGGLTHFKEQLDYHLNLNFNSRDTVGDNYNNANERFYGNNDVTGPDADHGTHVAGIIGAVRDNNLGIMGVANDVAIMSVRTVPTGDERDKDVANAIRYAAANGARVINMSFGKSYSYNKKTVDEAVKFALSKDVLLVHAAGNDNNNTEVELNVPNRAYEDKSGVAGAWIEVGASGPKDDETLKASFSNYGKTSVDVFAPGVAINSTTPKSTYGEHDGTSMAAPVVTGLAALIRSYYPKLTATQVKEIIMKSVVKISHNVVIKDGDNKKEVPFADICVTGGVVNAYNALQLATTY
jgi:subtilisin family serine protease